MSIGLTVKEWCEAVGKSERFAYAGLKTGKLKSDRFGGLHVIQVSEVERFKKSPFQISYEELRK